jgi:hypothetical protein
MFSPSGAPSQITNSAFLPSIASNIILTVLGKVMSPHKVVTFARGA